MAREVPVLGPLRATRQPRVVERTLSSGLRVLAIRHTGVPLVEIRLRIPFAGRGSAHLARAKLLASCLFSGTDQRDAEDLAAALQLLGGDLGAAVDADKLSVGGSVLATNLRPMLDLLGEVLTAAAYSPAEVRGERDRLGQRLGLAMSQPGRRAREALVHRLYGSHPYGREMPAPDEVARQGPAVLRRLHAERVAPTGAVLVLVGDLRPAQMLDAVESALDVWSAPSEAVTTPPVPSFAPGVIQLVDRPGSVQTTIRMGGPALSRSDAGYAALKLANLIFGGYFSSRLVANIRERRGYTYSPSSGVDHNVAGSELTVSADVATEVTAPALLEIAYELGRIATLPVTADELEGARRYAIGSLALSVSTQAGLASTLAALTLADLDLGFLRDHPRDLAKVTSEELLEAARSYLAPTSLVTILLGDAPLVRNQVAALGPVE